MSLSCLRAFGPLAAVCAVLLASVGASGEIELVDAVAAVVGDEIILESEIDEELYIYRMRTGGAAISEEEGRRIRSEIVSEMVEEALLVAMARRDTVVVTPEELNDEITRRVEDLKARHGSEEALSAALEAEGITLEELEDIYRDDVERRLLAERVVRTHVHSRVDVTWGEVEEYYEEHREEVARVPERYEVAGIVVSPKVAETAKRAAIERMTEVRRRIEEGEPFEDLAREYSDDASAAVGGDLGFFERGVMVPEFEEAAFALEPGEVSGIVPTRFGFHIIEVLDREEARLRARHILARVMPGADDDARAQARAESLRQRVIAGEDFAKIAELYSDDPSTGRQGGGLGWFTVEQLAPAFHEALTGLSPGDITPVVRGDGGHYVIKLLNHEQPRIADLDEVRENLKEYLFGLKAEEAYEALIERLSGEIFVDVRTEMVPRE